MLLILMLFVALPLSATDCLPVEGDWITGSDVAPQVPVFAQASGRPVAPSPIAGATRTMPRAELRRHALRLGLTAEDFQAWPVAVCFAYRMEPLGEQKVLAALGRTFPGRRLELADFSRFPVPPGEIVFSASPWRKDRRDGTKLVTGHVAYGPGRRAAVWARIRPLASSRGLVAAQDLPAGARLGAHLVRPGELEPGSEQPLEDPQEVEGLVARRRIPAGMPITKAMLGRPPDVARGDTVWVEARAGNALLSFPSRAETAGSAGERILLTNPQSGQRFRARVTAAGKASAETGVGAGGIQQQ